MIYLWQEERGRPYYRFQTDVRAIANKMKRRNKFRLIGWGVNTELWIYSTQFARPDIARNALRTLSGNKVNFNQDEEIFYCLTDRSDNEKEVA